jgi:hypothetical protein
MNPARASDDGKNHPPHVDVDIVVARTQASARDARADDDVDDDDDALGDVIDASASFERANARARVAVRRSHRARVVIGPKRVVIVVIATDEDEARCAGRDSIRRYTRTKPAHDDATRSTAFDDRCITLSSP